MVIRDYTISLRPFGEKIKDFFFMSFGVRLNKKENL